MKKNYKALILSMAAVIALTTTSSAMAMHVPGLSQMHSLNAKLNKKKRKLEKTTNQADQGVVEYRSQNYLDRKGNKEDKTQVQIAVLEQEKAALIRQYPHLKAYENGSSTTEVVQEKSGKEKHGHGHDHGASDEAYVILDDGTEVRLRDLQAYSLGGDERVAGNGQGDDVSGNGQGKDPGGNGQGTDPNNGGTDPNNGGTDPNNGGTDPNNGGTDPNNGGTDPNNGGTDPGTVPPKNEKKKEKDGGDRQDQEDPKNGKEKGKEKSKTPVTKTPAKKTTPVTKTPAKKTPPKNEKKATPGGDRQDQQDDKKAKQKAEQDKINKEKSDEAARLKRETERLAQLELDRKKRQEQIDLKNKEKKKEEEKKPECKLPVVGEKKCLPAEEEKDEQVEVSSGTVNGRIKGKDKDEAKSESQLYGQSGITKSEKQEKSKLKINARFKGATVDEAALLAKTIDGIFEKRDERQAKVGNQTGLKKTGEKSPTESTTNRQANNASNSNRAQ